LAISVAINDTAARTMVSIMAAHMSSVAALRKLLEAEGVEFIDENGGGPGVRLRKNQRKKG
jgi:hypothetical protein